MSVPKTMAQLFGQAILIERTAAAFYAALAGLFRHLPEVSGFWLTLHGDEREHEAILMDVLDRLPPEILSQAPEPGLAEQVADVARRIETIDAGSITTLEDAYELAHDLEFSEVNAIFKVLAMTAVPAETHRLFVLDHIERHQNRLLEFGRAHGGRDGRRRITPC